MRDEEARKMGIEKLGEEGYAEANAAAARALGALLRAIDGHTLDSLANAAGLLLIAVVRADGGTLHDAQLLLTRAWDSETVMRISSYLEQAATIGEQN